MMSCSFYCLASPVFIDVRILPMSFQHRLVALAILFSLLACRPVLTIGWGELFIFGVILLIFVGPMLWRFYRRYRKFRKHERDEENL